MFGLGPIPAVKLALDRAGWKLGDTERIEVNEAFAAIVIAVVRAWPARGHRQRRGRCGRARPSDRRDRGDSHDPTDPFDAARRPQARVVTLCIGGGQGIALARDALT